jgi:hypothetical protein
MDGDKLMARAVLDIQKNMDFMYYPDTMVITI